LSQFGYGWNVDAANNKYCDLMEAGVVDVLVGAERGVM
jgi:hypothetical protein